MGDWSGAQVASRSRDSQVGQNQADIPYRRRPSGESGRGRGQRLMPYRRKVRVRRLLN